MVRLVVFILGGALAGFAYHRLVGCSTGGCPITSNPYLSAFFGAAMGYLLSGGAS